MLREPCTYILASRRQGSLYIGVTSDLAKRVWQHKHDIGGRFTRSYGIHHLVWFERHETMVSAIQREKALKKWLRAWKIRLIEQTNPTWRDLYPELFGAL